MSNSYQDFRSFYYFVMDEKDEIGFHSIFAFALTKTTTDNIKNAIEKWVGVGTIARPKVAYGLEPYIKLTELGQSFLDMAEL